MNKWKVAFWICFTVLLFCIYTGASQAISLVKTSAGYSKTAEDLESVSRVINFQKIKKEDIQSALKDHSLFSQIDFRKDTITLNTLQMIFRDNKLIQINNIGRGK
jgi:hypothetical protein